MVIEQYQGSRLKVSQSWENEGVCWLTLCSIEGSIFIRNPDYDVCFVCSSLIFSANLPYLPRRVAGNPGLDLHLFVTEIRRSRLWVNRCALGESALFPLARVFEMNPSRIVMFLL